MVIFRALFARTQKRLGRNRLWKSGAGAPKGSLHRGAGRQRRSEGFFRRGWHRHLAPGGFACSTSLAESAIAGVLKLAALKQSSTPDANSTHGIRHGLPGPCRTEDVPAMSPTRGQAAVSMRLNKKSEKKTNPGL